MMNPPPNEPNRRLKEAVRSVETPSELDAGIRLRIEDGGLAEPRSWGRLILAGAAVAALAGLAVVIARNGLWQRTPDTQESFIASVSNHVTSLMRVGLGDHLNCAFFRKYPAQAEAVEEMPSALGPKYQDLMAVVRQQVPARYKLVLGHQCVYHGRQFIHLALKDDQHLMSLVITAKRDGESFQIEGLVPALVQAGVPVYTSGADRFQIAAVETPQHLIYFISDLQGEQNRQLLLAMASDIGTILGKMQG